MPLPTELCQNEEKRMPATAEAAAEVFDEIEPVYFLADGFDAPAHELSKMLGEELELDEIERERFKLKRQLRVVSQKVSALITKNSVAFGEHVANYEVVRSETSELVGEIAALRRILQKEQATARNALAIVAADRQQWWLGETKRALGTLKTLHETGYRLRDLMQASSLAAIALCVEAKHAANLYSSYDSIRDMSNNLSKKLESMEAHIDDALASSTVVFNYDRYALIQTAYQMLGKTETAAQKLQRFFHATVESSARSVLIELLNRTTEIHEPEAMSYEELSRAIPAEHSLECVQEMGLVLCKVLCNYHTILKFHIEEDERALTALGVECVAMDGPQIVERGVFQISLIEGLHGMFQTAASKYNTLLGLQELSHLKFDAFIQIVEMTNRFRRFGRLHFNNSFAELLSTLERQMNAYFAQYHRNRMEELRFFLENEAFALCPVPLQFTLFDLPSPDGLKLVGNGKQTSLDRASSEESCYAQDDPAMENALSSVCNTALNLLKFFGRYIRMTSVLHSITEQVIHSIVELFDYFFFALELLRPVLESLLPSGKKSPELTHFYKTVLPASFDLREAAYGCAASRVLNSAQIVKQVGQTDWKIAELSSAHSQYVDVLCKEMSEFNKRLEKAKEFAHVSSEIRAVLWTQLVRCVFRALVDAYAEASKKCSNEGRALMLLDFQQLNHDIEAISDLKPVPHKAFVEDYVKAFYLPESCIEEWIRQHPEYSSSQLAALTSHVSPKKSKLNILNVLDGKDASAR
ncbi:Coiled-coil domain-containing protein [Aphelenchoides fujianensis]|nr:Coiled-coil domain-containing protein [Aphelenchoides fujianensis]